MKLKAEDNLATVKNQIVDLIAYNSKVIEFGCGNGDLLFKLSPRIQSGLGIDSSEMMISYALKQMENKKISNIGFQCKELGIDYRNSKKHDFSIASLFFHTIPKADSIYLLKIMIEISDNVLICEFSRPNTFQQKSLLWLDQKLAGYYRNFRLFQKNGYLEGILAETHYSSLEVYDTSIPFIKIYKMN